MIGPLLKSHLNRIGEPVFRKIHLWGISPNALTFAGLGISFISATLLTAGQFFWAGVATLGAGLFDMLDGGVARARGGSDRFGAFLDSIVDRYSDLFLLMGVLLFYARQGRLALVGLCCLAILGTVLIPYARARAECFLPQCSVGWMERPERILLLAAGALLELMPWALALLTLLTHITVLQRVHYCWKRLSIGGDGGQGWEGP